MTDTKPPSAFPFESKFVTIDGYKIHYIEEGGGDPILFIHGNPTWSYLWRNILPAVAKSTGKRGIALDLLGFGKSDKPAVEYTVDLHYKIVEGFIERLGLKNITLVLHDWGGAFGMGYAVRHPENVRAITLMETSFWPAEWKDFGKAKPIFKLFRSPVGYLMIQVMNMFVKKFLPSAVIHKEHMTEDVMRNYREPFPTVASRRAVRLFPNLIPVEGVPKESYDFMKDVEARASSLRMPALLIKATPGMLVDTEEKVNRFKKSLPQITVKDFGPGLHYIQEDDPEKISRLLVEWMGKQRP